jgi:DNA-binding transcriptional LysR family regulator
LQPRCGSCGQELCRRSYDGAIFAVLAKKGRRAVLPNVEVRYLRAVIALAEELNFTRAAHRLHITQPALSKQIAELEEEYRFQLFTGDKRRVVDVTDAGRVFVEEARSALLHGERAIELARATQEGGETVLVIGYSPYADESWISTILSVLRFLADGHTNRLGRLGELRHCSTR